MLTKKQRLKIENQVLRNSIEHIKKARDRMDQGPLGEVYNGTAVSRFLGSVDCAVDYGDCLKRKLEMAEYLQKENPGSSQEPGKSISSSTSPL